MRDDIESDVIPFSVGIWFQMDEVSHCASNDSLTGLAMLR